jgi:hypothetical protein
VFSSVVKNMGSTLGACGDVNRNVMGPAGVLGGGVSRRAWHGQQGGAQQRSALCAFCGSAATSDKASRGGEQGGRVGAERTCAHAVVEPQ